MSYNQTIPLPHPETIAPALHNIQANEESESLMVAATLAELEAMRIAVTGYDIVGNIVRVAATGRNDSTGNYTLSVGSKAAPATPQDESDWLEFERHRLAWMATRKRISSIAGDITRNPHYFNIAGMGKRALPFILRHLRQEFASGKIDHWFPALLAINGGVNPVPPQAEGRMRQMAEAWIEWGRREGILDGEGLGSGIP
jgi:hypothetical protein